jgi:aminoglycoside/choline kinase family phosphotransferase
MSPLDLLLRESFGRPAGAFTEEPLPQHASARTYVRLHFTRPEAPYPPTLMVMRLPPDPLRSDEGEGGDRPAELPFLTMAELLRARDVPVPLVHGHDLAAGLVLLEDLGDETFEARLQRVPADEWASLYGPAVDLLADMHAACADLPEGSLPTTRRFDEALLRWELDHFREWGLEALHGPLDADDRALLDRSFDALARALTSSPQGFVHRDYQSRNLLWAPASDGADGDARLAIIDFQDALLGPRVYDLVALLCDSYVEITPALRDAMIARYAERRGFTAEASRALAAEFALQAVQRKLKDAGRFVFIDRERKNPGFLRHYPQSLAYVGQALERLPEHAALRDLLGRTLPGFPDACPVPAPTSR